MDVVAALTRTIRTVPDFPKPGIVFKDLTPVFKDAELLMQAVEALAEPYMGVGITQVVGIEARGFILGSMLAHRLACGFVPVRKKGKLPYETLRIEYDLEYGTDVVEMHADAVGPDDHVLIHDDVIATGGTARATKALVQQTGAYVAGFAFLVELGFLKGRALLGDDTLIHAVLTY